MRIGDWIDAQRPVVPAGFRSCLQADGPASPAGFAAAAVEALAALASPDDPALGAHGRGPKTPVALTDAPAPMGTACAAGDAPHGAAGDAPSKRAEQSSAACGDGSGPAHAGEHDPLGAGGDASSKHTEQSSAAPRGGSGPGRAREHDRRSAFALLALDAYVTYACLLALDEDDATVEIQDVAAIVTRQWPPGAPAQDRELRQDGVVQAPTERRAPGPAPERAS